MSTWLLPLVILMSTPGSPLLVTPANAMATSHANMPPRHDPLIPAIWLWKNEATHAHSPQFKETSSHFILSDYSTGGKCHFIGDTFHINSYFPDNNWLHSYLFVLYSVSSPTHYVLQHFLFTWISLMQWQWTTFIWVSMFSMVPSAWLKHTWPETVHINHLNGDLHWTTCSVLDEASSVSGKLAHTLLVTKTNKTRHLTKTASRVWLL